MLVDVPRLEGARVTVMGLGLFDAGVGVTKYLCRSGARVTVTDLKSAEDLHASVAELAGWPVEFHLGEHREKDFRQADLVVASPGVPLDSPWLSLAPAVETELNLFVKLCRARTVYGITGSNGKTTTTTLIARILEQGPRRTWLGGNIGVSLLPVVDEIAPEDVVVLELSSFQLENLDAIRRSPQVAVVLNVTPNHLDRHGSMDRYVAAKRAIVAHQGDGGLRVLNADDPVVRNFAGGTTRWFGETGDAMSGTWIQGESIHHGGRVLDVSARRLAGRFHLHNMAAAVAATAGAFDGWGDAAEQVFGSFAGVEHRMEYVVERDGVTYYDDSIATTPERTLAALDTLTGPLVILLGGYDKKLPFADLGRRVRERCRAAVVFGQTADAIAESLRPRETVAESVRMRESPGEPDGFELHRAASFDDAVAAARSVARPGDTVLLSPACASYGMFGNFVERGRRFKELVRG
ncbi:UDP-N-acetylmuramoyl-L-alanine--D-glutamate ligase [Actinopolymorpha sp. B9G3]|uniref:UDP-N-acetylmuramoyl-L-alanine--D-glutamate ligase n=1 Tax=Actinopolymorpha sp. B9G3 TaxID=3158970 RepID=UPI0032D9352A